eukprot:TRINITY_DN272_c0_g1_i1.p1 TRINITY_DN272_c0_g1~~TRINITY_DN272_c0_g1_i1.p1  ORF type:complete len:282 (+),score=63.91 TRINITY_DN272_c0_g1_i1:76-846(+)
MKRRLWKALVGYGHSCASYHSGQHEMPRLNTTSSVAEFFPWRSQKKSFSSSSSRLLDLTQLPTRVPFFLYEPNLNDAKQQYHHHKNGDFETSKSVKALAEVNSLSRNHMFFWKNQKPKTILMVKKEGNPETTLALLHISNWIIAEYPGTRIIVEHTTANDNITDLPAATLHHLPFFNTQQKGELWRVIDLVITIGGDGTILHLSSLFDTPSASVREACKSLYSENMNATAISPTLTPPPIISFSMGTLGFLMPFNA